jgi:winged helix DNA-binding protein
VAAEHVLSARRLNRAVLARQLLLGRVRASLPRALERMAGIQAQYAPAMYVGLWSRVEGFRRDDLTRALERRTVVQGTLLRATIHVVSAEDYWPFAIAVREARRAWWRRNQGKGIADADVAAAVERLDARLADGPVDQAELDAVVGRPPVPGIGLWLDLVRVPPSGTWERRRADRYASAASWLGPPDVEPAVARRLVVERYLRGFGPARPTDVAAWAGLPVREIVAVLGQLSLRRYRDDAGQELVDWPGAPLPREDVQAPVRFLSNWDAILLGHARAKGVLSEDLRPAVFTTKNPQSVATVLVDGAVAATWRYDGDAVRIEPLRALRRSERRAVEDEAERLTAFHRDG